MQLCKEAWKKIQDFNEVWTRDHAITGAMLYQLSYEATDVGSRSIVGSYVPVKEMSVNDIYVVVNFLFRLIFIYPLFWGMVMHANEFNTKEKQKITDIKN